MTVTEPVTVEVAQDERNSEFDEKAESIDDMTCLVDDMTKPVPRRSTTIER
jgi:hypothetical protein